MTSFTGAIQSVHVAFARMLQLVGWAGVAGVALLSTASVVLALALSAHVAFRQERAVRQAVIPASDISTASRSATPIVVPGLPLASDIPLLLTQIEYAALGNGLEWRAAEYRVIAATSLQPASLEVRCSLKGPYPKLRAMLVQLTRSIPAFTVRDFAANRPTSDVSDIETKLVLAVLLQDIAAASDAPGKSAP